MIANGRRAVKRIRPDPHGSEQLLAGYHELYGVFVNGETLFEPECTLQIPVES
jgi:hypothetical protein